MTNKEIIKRAIEKAEENGFDLESLYWGHFDRLMEQNKLVDSYIDIFYNFPELLVFRKDFAKALFGEGEHNYKEVNGVDSCTNCPAFGIPHEYYPAEDFCWQVHLQQMILEEEPLKYLEKFL